MTINAQREVQNLADQTLRLKRHAENLTTGADQRPIAEIAAWIYTLREINAAASASMTALVTAGYSDTEIATFIAVFLPWPEDGKPINLSSATASLQAAVVAGEAVVAAYRSEGIETAVQGPCYGPLPDDRTSPHPVLTVDVSALKPAVQGIIDALPLPI